MMNGWCCTDSEDIFVCSFRLINNNELVSCVRVSRFFSLPQPLKGASPIKPYFRGNSVTKNASKTITHQRICFVCYNFCLGCNRTVSVIFFFFTQNRWWCYTKQRPWCVIFCLTNHHRMILCCCCWTPVVIVVVSCCWSVVSTNFSLCLTDC